MIWGGITIFGQRFDDGAMLDLQKMKWKRLPEAPLGPRYGHRSLLWGSRLIIYGGLGQGIAGDGAILDLQKMQWEELPELPFEGSTAPSFVICGSKLLIWGGREHNTIFNEGGMLDLKKLINSKKVRR